MNEVLAILAVAFLLVAFFNKENAHVRVACLFIVVVFVLVDFLL